ncbi:MAG: 4a-hydroxytetrahydrobiopterin dehydratase [bacterium]|nr:4a-hydroxytetrahydrobiopterin dehydratase [bacterium]
MDLLSKKCVPCEGGVKPFGPAEIKNYIKEVPGWLVFNFKKLDKEFKFKYFKEAMEFVNKVAALAEAEGHHPDIAISYNKVRLGLTTHAIGGLSENDFILAAKIDKLFS